MTQINNDSERYIGSMSTDSHIYHKHCPNHGAARYSCSDELEALLCFRFNNGAVVIMSIRYLVRTAGSKLHARRYSYSRSMNSCFGRFERSQSSQSLFKEEDESNDLISVGKFCEANRELSTYATTRFTGIDLLMYAGSLQ